MVSANNSINNTVGASISGVTNTLTITNPSNSASSAAKTIITVGGGASDDPSLQWSVDSVTDWAMGIDNGDSDKLKISQSATIGTNDTWIMSTSGERTMPLQPCFLALLSSTVTNVTGDGTDYTIICDEVDTNIGSHYNNTTGIFTAPIDGIYSFSAGVTIGNISSAHTRSFFALDGGSNTLQSLRLGQGNVANMKGSSDAMHFSGGGLLNLNAGDMIEIRIQVYNGTKTVQVVSGSSGEGLTYFEGRLVQ